MGIKKFLENVCDEIKYKSVRNGISDELETHMCDIKEEYITMGMNESDAEEKAVLNMGDAREIGKKLNKIHRPKFEWKILMMISIFISIKIFLNLKQYIGRYSSWSLSKDLFFIAVSLLIGMIIYFGDYRKNKKSSNIIYIVATGILLFQWINWRFNIDIKVSEIINKMFGNENKASSILNMNLWYISIILYIISFAGNLTNLKKINLIIMYSFSAILIYLQSTSVINTLILILAYLFMYGFKMIKDNKKTYKDIIIISCLILFLSVIIMFAIESVIGPSVERLYNEMPEYQEEKYKLLNNIELFGGSQEIYFTNTNSQFLQLLATIGIIPSSILVFFIMLMSIILIIDLIKVQEIYGKLLIIGLGTLYIVQSVLHILMNLNMFPTSNVNLPFLSNGNLFLLANVIGFATIMSVYRRKDIIFENVKNEEKGNALKRI